MVRINKKKSPSTRRRALIRQRERNSQRVFEGETGRLKNGPRLGDCVYGTHLSIGFA